MKPSEGGQLRGGGTEREQDLGKVRTRLKCAEPQASESHTTGTLFLLLDLWNMGTWREQTPFLWAPFPFFLVHEGKGRPWHLLQARLFLGTVDIHSASKTLWNMKGALVRKVCGRAFPRLETG